MTTNPMIYTGFQAQNPVILDSFSSLFIVSTILSVNFDVIKHFGTNIPRKIQLLSKTRSSADMVARVSSKEQEDELLEKLKELGYSIIQYHT